MSKIIAIDFDGTLFVTDYTTILAHRPAVIARARAAKANGDRLILWTCREGRELAEAIAACRAVGLEFDAVNDNLGEAVDQWGCNPRKVGADEYWDDKAVAT